MKEKLPKCKCGGTAIVEQHGVECNQCFLWIPSAYSDWHAKNDMTPVKIWKMLMEEKDEGKTDLI